MHVSNESRPLFGDLLRQVATLSGHDVEEILQEQKGTRRRFGEIALSWGLCEPRHVWEAWGRQLERADGKVDLDQLGIDTQATAFLSREEALRLEAIPIRLNENELIVAVATMLEAPYPVALVGDGTRRLKLVRADREQIHRAIRRYYGDSAAA